MKDILIMAIKNAEYNVVYDFIHNTGGNSSLDNVLQMLMYVRGTNVPWVKYAGSITNDIFVDVLRMCGIIILKLVVPCSVYFESNSFASVTC